MSKPSKEQEQEHHFFALNDQLIREIIDAEKKLKALWLKQARLQAIMFGNEYAFAHDIWQTDKTDSRRTWLRSVADGVGVSRGVQVDEYRRKETD